MNKVTKHTFDLPGSVVAGDGRHNILWKWKNHSGDATGVHEAMREIIKAASIDDNDKSTIIASALQKPRANYPTRKTFENAKHTGIIGLDKKELKVGDVVNMDEFSPLGPSSGVSPPTDKGDGPPLVITGQGDYQKHYTPNHSKVHASIIKAIRGVWAALRRRR